MSNFFTRLSPEAKFKLKFAFQLSLTVLVPAVPLTYFHYRAVQSRSEREKEVRTKTRIPSVQTVDELLIEKCQPGDVWLFDRRCENCVHVFEMINCMLGRALLSGGDGQDWKSSEGIFDHCGIVVPGPPKNDKALYDPHNLYLLEATAGSGITARPLLTRLEMTQSRTVLLLPLVSPGERRNDEDYEPSKKTEILKNNVSKQLVAFQKKWTDEAEKQNYKSGHSTLGILGALGYAFGLQKTSLAPVSPSAWLVLSALQEAGAAMNVSERTAMETRVEDFLRDYRFHEKDTVRLRPGWKFLGPMTMRETGRS